MESKKSSYRYLLVIIGACIMMITYSTGSTALSFFVEPITQEFGYTESSFTLSYSVVTLAGVFGMPMMGKLFKRFGVRKVSLISSVFSTIGLIGLSKCSSLISFYFISAFFGFFKPAAVLGNTLLVDVWFLKKKGTILGITMAGSGLGGVILGMIVPWFISIYGWRRAYIFLAIFQLILTLIAILIIKNTPQSVGLRKYGEIVDVNSPVAELTGISYKDALKMPQFYLLYMGSVLVCIVSGFLQHMPAYYTGIGISSLKAGSLISILMLSVTIVKIVVGMLNDKLGVKIVNLIIHISYFFGFIILIISGANYLMLAFASVLLSFGYSSILVFSALITKSVFGEKDYSGIYGIIGTATFVGTSIGTPAWGMIYDITKSYNVGIVISAILTLIIAIIYTIAVRINKEEELSKAITENTL